MSLLRSADKIEAILASRDPIAHMLVRDMIEVGRTFVNRLKNYSGDGTTFSVIIQEALAGQDTSATELAGICATNATTISRWARGASPHELARVEAVKRLREFLEANLERLAWVENNRDPVEVESKIATREEALRRASCWHKSALRIGFTNGCFDLLHVGHIHLLTRARAECDRLIVGLNTDVSIRRLVARKEKPEGRPIQSETDRAKLVGCLGVVDLVVLFPEERSADIEDDTPTQLIRGIKPDVLVKGADYREDEIVGADIVKTWGGRVERVPFLEGYSTTTTIDRIRVSSATVEPVS